MRPYFGKPHDDGEEIHTFINYSTLRKAVDQKASQYTCKPKARKWKIATSFYILDTRRINSTRMMALKSKEDQHTQTFDIGFELTKSLFVSQM